MNEYRYSSRKMLELIKWLKGFADKNKFYALELFFYTVFQHIQDAYDHLTECFYKAAVEVCKIKKNLNLLKAIRNKSNSYYIHLCRVYDYTKLTYNEPKKLDLFIIKDAFGNFHKEIILPQLLKHKMYVPRIILFFLKKKTTILFKYAETKMLVYLRNVKLMYA